ncbi:hypothetical protein QJS10_CPB21g01412 [Acorus calamus]|uniref:Uncharacterized protein n=1 Tax=Acorus calamus TaxID=4465 RepID=A0AAV9C7Q8_ACOCL|nr:hypothetical protein QJS10_CPB21g01412 [Acorus calamus]
MKGFAEVEERMDYSVKSCSQDIIISSMDRTNSYDGTFAFNDPCFSDRVLKVMVIAGPQDEKLKAKLGDGVAKRLLDLKREEICAE